MKTTFLLVILASVIFVASQSNTCTAPSGATVEANASFRAFVDGKCYDQKCVDGQLSGPAYPAPYESAEVRTTSPSGTNAVSCQVTKCDADGWKTIVRECSCTLPQLDATTAAHVIASGRFAEVKIQGNLEVTCQVQKCSNGVLVIATDRICGQCKLEDKTAKTGEYFFTPIVDSTRCHRVLCLPAGEVSADENDIVDCPTSNTKPTECIDANTQQRYTIGSHTAPVFDASIGKCKVIPCIQTEAGAAFGEATYVDCACINGDGKVFAPGSNSAIGRDATTGKCFYKTCLSSSTGASWSDPTYVDCPSSGPTTCSEAGVQYQIDSHSPIERDVAGKCYYYICRQTPNGAAWSDQVSTDCPNTDPKCIDSDGTAVVVGFRGAVTLSTNSGTVANTFVCAQRVCSLDEVKKTPYWLTVSAPCNACPLAGVTASAIETGKTAEFRDGNACYVKICVNGIFQTSTQACAGTPTPTVTCTDGGVSYSVGYTTAPIVKSDGTCSASVCGTDGKFSTLTVECKPCLYSTSDSTTPVTVKTGETRSFATVNANTNTAACVIRRCVSGTWVNTDLKCETTTPVTKCTTSNGASVELNWKSEVRIVTGTVDKCTQSVCTASGLVEASADCAWCVRDNTVRIPSGGTASFTTAASTGAASSCVVRRCINGVFKDTDLKCDVAAGGCTRENVAWAVGSTLKFNEVTACDIRICTATGAWVHFQDCETTTPCTDEKGNKYDNGYTSPVLTNADNTCYVKSCQNGVWSNRPTDCPAKVTCSRDNQQFSLGITTQWWIIDEKSNTKVCVVRVCSSEGTWKDTDKVCETTCVDGGRVYGAGWTTSVWQDATTQTCYQSRCTENGWTKDIVVCPAPVFCSVGDSGSYRVGAIFEFKDTTTCVVKKCTEDGTWLAVEQPCAVKVTCQLPTSDSVFGEGSIYTWTDSDNKCYKIRCTSAGWSTKWVCEQARKCIDSFTLKAFDVGTVNVYRSATGDCYSQKCTNDGWTDPVACPVTPDTTTVFCKYGDNRYEVGSKFSWTFDSKCSIITCLPSGKWTDAVSCDANVEVTCREEDQPFTVGEYFTFISKDQSCRKITCLSTGKWGNSEVSDECKIAPTGSTVAHCQGEDGKIFDVGQTFRYKKGDRCALATCSVDGSWKVELQDCPTDTPSNVPTKVEGISVKIVLKKTNDVPLKISDITDALKDVADQVGDVSIVIKSIETKEDGSIVVEFTVLRNTDSDATKDAAVKEQVASASAFNSRGIEAQTLSDASSSDPVPSGNGASTLVSSLAIIALILAL